MAILECLLTTIFYFFNARIIIKWIGNKFKTIPKEERTDLCLLLVPLAVLASSIGFVITLIETGLAMKAIDYIVK